MYKYYNIHGVLSLKTNVKGLIPKYFEVDKPRGVEFEIIESDFKIDKRSYKKIGSFYGSEDSVYFESNFYGIPIYKILIKDIKGKTGLYFNKTTRQIFNVQKLAFILLQVKLLQRGYSLLHAGAVSKNGKGSVLLGWPGVGKSSTIFGLVGDTFGFLGDDTIIVSADGHIYAYPQDVGVFYKSENLENLNLSLLKELELFTRYIISKIPPFNRYVGCKIMVDMTDLVKIENRAKLGRVFFLEHGNGTKSIDNKVSLNRMIASSIQSLFDHYLSNKMFYSYCYITGFDPGFIEKEMRKILEKTVRTPTKVLMSEKKDFNRYLV